MNELVRDGSGRFPKGMSGNPAGRPTGRKNEIVQLKQEMELAIRSHVHPEKLKKIIEKMINKAMNGNIAAAKLIFDHFLSKATETEDAVKDSGGITIRIENATFKAQAEEKQIVAVEGKFEELK